MENFKLFSYCSAGYYLIGGCISDMGIARYLDLSYEEYIEILKKYNAILNNGGYYFETIKETKNVLEKLVAMLLEKETIDRDEFEALIANAN